MPRAKSFITRQREQQGGHFGERGGYAGAPYRLDPARYLDNFHEAIRGDVEACFGAIQPHRHISHGLSSQACCMNFLLPLAKRGDVLLQIVGAALGIDGIEMLPADPRPGTNGSLVEFEWTGLADYLGEWKDGRTPARGANATAADAMLRLRHGSEVEILLIEWKYTERYGAPLTDRRDPNDETKGGNATRIARYRDRAFAPDGPIRADLGIELADFFWEPFYQLLRQQMLAWQMERAQEGGASRVRVLHISPRGNRDLHAVTSPKFKDIGGQIFDDAFDAFSSVLAAADDGVPRFLARTTDEVFGAALRDLKEDRWAGYIRGRYPFALADAARL